MILIRSWRKCEAENWTEGRLVPEIHSHCSLLSQRYLSSLDSIDHINESSHPWIWIHTYARLLLLEYYADYSYNDDPEHNFVHYDDLDTSWQVMNQKRLTLECLSHALSTFVGPHAHRENSYAERIQNLSADAAFLAERYDRACRLLQQRVQYFARGAQDILLKRQLEETKESKLTAISLGRLSKLAFVFIPPTFVCTLLGMNLAVFGQGTIALKVFIILAISVSFLSFLPVVIKSYELWDRSKWAYSHATYTSKLAWRSPVAGLWYALFVLCHSRGVTEGLYNYVDNLPEAPCLEDVFRSHWQEMSGGVVTRFIGNEEFWKRKVRKHIFAIRNEYGWEKQSFISRQWHAWRQSKGNEPSKKSSC